MTIRYTSAGMRSRMRNDGSRTSRRGLASATETDTFVAVDIPRCLLILPLGTKFTWDDLTRTQRARKEGGYIPPHPRTSGCTLPVS